jgi:rhodanese-related sulfurtransferase
MSKPSRPTTISDITRVSPQTLSSLILSENTSSSVAIIDVRDSDHIGGHIKSSTWVPSNELDARIPELIRLHGDKDKIVFHCTLSQQRGPSAALKFARALSDKQQKEGKEKNKSGEGPGSIDAGKEPEVCVLEGGFGVWQAKYGEDERLTEGFVKDLWE